MPLFSRSDGTLIKTESAVRQIMPYLMRGRNEAVVYHETRYDLTRTLPWLAAQNAALPADSGKKITLFHLLLFAYARTLHQRKGLNRFISGSRIWQRKGVWISFAAKKAFADDAPISTVKLEFPEDITFQQVVERTSGTVGGVRRGEKRAVDTELKLALALPVPMIRMLIGFMRWLDSMNLLPGAMIRTDPMYASLFMANLGSIGIGDVYHHLFEYGTVSLFSVVGRVEKMIFIDDNGAPAVRDGVKICWSLDERINDGFYCVNSLKIAQQIVENPAEHLA
jgi:hypothetical protein